MFVYIETDILSSSSSSSSLSSSLPSARLTFLNRMLIFTSSQAFSMSDSFCLHSCTRSLNCCLKIIQRIRRGALRNPVVVFVPVIVEDGKIELYHMLYYVCQMMNNKLLFTMIYHFFMKPGIGTHIHKQTPLLQSIESISLSHLPTNQPT